MLSASMGWKFSSPSSSTRGRNWSPTAYLLIQVWSMVKGLIPPRESVTPILTILSADAAASPPEASCPVVSPEPVFSSANASDSVFPGCAPSSAFGEEQPIMAAVITAASIRPTALLTAFFIILLLTAFHLSKYNPRHLSWVILVFLYRKLIHYTVTVNNCQYLWEKSPK